MPIAIRWYCVQLHRRREAEAWNNLRLRGYEAYVPLTRVERRHARQVWIVDAPMLPGYGFVRLDLRRPGWQGVWRAPGIIRILGTNPESPEPVPDALIAALRTLPEGADPRPALTTALVPEGASVTFSEGAWANHQGVCILSDEKRALIAVSIFGRLSHVEVSDQRQLRITSVPKAS